MLSYSLKVNYANLKAPIRSNYLSMFDMFGKCVVFTIAHMQLTRYIEFRRLKFENADAERLRLHALTAESLPQLNIMLGLQDHLPIAVDLLPFVEDFIGMYYHCRMENYISYTIDGFYNLHMQLKQV